MEKIQKFEEIIQKQAAQQVFFLRHLSPEKIALDTGLELSLVKTMIGNENYIPLTLEERKLFDTHAYFKLYKNQLQQRRKMIETVMEFFAREGVNADDFCDRRNISIRDFKEASTIIRNLNVNVKAIVEESIEEQKEERSARLISKTNSKSHGFAFMSSTDDEQVEEQKRGRTEQRTLHEEFDILMETLNYHAITMVRTQIAVKRDEITSVSRRFSGYLSGVMGKRYNGLYLGRASKKVIFDYNGKLSALMVDVLIFSSKDVLAEFEKEQYILWSRWKRLAGEGANMYLQHDKLDELYQCVTLSPEMIKGFGTPRPKSGNAAALYLTAKIEPQRYSAKIIKQHYEPMLTPPEMVDSQLKRARERDLQNKIWDYLKENYPNKELDHAMIVDVAERFEIKSQKYLNKILALPTPTSKELAEIGHKFYLEKINETGLTSVHAIALKLGLSVSHVKSLMKLDLPPLTDQERVVLKTHRGLAHLNQDTFGKKHEEYENLMPYLRKKLSDEELAEIAQSFGVQSNTIKRRLITLRKANGIKFKDLK